MRRSPLHRHPLVLALAAALPLALLAGCQRAAAPAPATPAAAPAPAAPTIGIDLAALDKAVRPGDDFYAYANGGWEKTAQIPADRASTGVFYTVFEKAEQRQAEIVQGLAKAHPAPGTDARKLADYYAAYMDEATIERRGLAPLQPTLDAIARIGDRRALSAYLGSTLRADVDPINATNFYTPHLFGLFVAQGLADPAHNYPYLLQGGLGMPDREYYLSPDPAMAKNRQAYQAYIVALLRQAGTPDAEAKARAIFDLERQIAQAQASVVETQDIHKANNPWPTAELGQRAPGLDWPAFLAAAGLENRPVLIAWQPEAIRKLSALVARVPLPVWQDYLRFQALNENAALLPKAYADLRFGFYGTQLQGIKAQRPRWKRALAATNDALGDALGRLYVERYFPPASKARVEAMVANILAAFRDGIDQLDWMSPQTKAEAKRKAAAMRVMVGYPDHWRDYSGLEVKADDALGNAQRAAAAEYRHQLAKLDQAPDRGEWWMTPQTVNAVNLPLQNAMNFPAAILQPPFFDPKADDAANYGSIGAVIGHEISHGFDNLGAEFDADGRLHNWWTAQDAAHFKAATDRLVQQYDAYQPLPGLHINGRQTLGENIADVSGLQAALRAYRSALGGKPAPVLDGFSGEQRFFIAFAQSWREKMREAALRAQVVGNEHAPGPWRALTVRNLDAWYAAFDVQPGQALYLAPAERVRIW
ncbi:M13 family metallopeptidase [Thermomonas flagellata]|uniref:M13 family metallopeptidase n=1 Tax=Thermomonas flagellata TaxID=2888524 RepID=UPI001F03BB82|nr:M13 family metallopeptidase [Thermomonas flagellata]